MRRINTRSPGPESKTLRQIQKVQTPTVAVAAGKDILIRPELEAPLAVERFTSFAEWTLKDGIVLLPPQQLVIATVIATEGLVGESDLVCCLNALAGAVRRGGSVHASWQSDGVLKRVSLSSVTMIAAHLLEVKNKEPVDWALEVQKFSDTLLRFYPGAKDIRPKNRIRAVLSDCSAWLFLHLPMICSAHICGHLKLSLLPDTAHERKLGGQARQTNAEKTTAVGDVLARAKDLASETVLDAASTASRSRWIVDALKRLVYVNAGQDGIRSADFVARDDVRQRLDSVTVTLVRIGTPNDALLLCWVLHLLESGSTRLKNPKISTITRYISAAVDRLHSALIAGTTAPAEKSQNDWEAMFKNLLCSEGVSTEVRCSLASFHWFLVSELGIDPLPWLFSGVDEVSAVSANVVWPHEVDRAKDILSTTVPDERMRQTMEVMLAIGAENKVRISDVRSIRLCNVRQVGEELLIEIAPRRTHHQGKSAAARRVLHFGNTDHCKTINAWVRRREQECAEFDDLLFGDPHDARKCYRIGACQRILNQILRSATGDPDVSYHSLRHTVISREILAALMTADVHQSISPIHKTAVEGAHRHESTTLGSYFHVPEEPVRCWLDRKIDTYLDSPVIAAKWLGKSADSLRQGRQRSDNKTKYLPGRLREYALPLVKAVACIYSSPPAIQATAQQPGLITIATAAKVLSDIKDRHGLQTVCSRTCIDEKTLAQISRAVVNVAGKLGRRAARHPASLSKNANNEACFRRAGIELQKSKFAFDFDSGPLFARLWEQAQAANESAELSMASASWVDVATDGVLSLHDADVIRPLIHFMQRGSIGPDHLVIRTEVSDMNDQRAVDEALNSAEMTAARALFEESYQVSVQTESVKLRRGGRPSTYLMVSRDRTGVGRASASASFRMSRLNGLMFVVSVWSQYSNVSAQESENGS